MTAATGVAAAGGRRIDDDPPADGPAVVAFGGGHGLAASLFALRRVSPRLTAVVTVADDGGSSGRLRTELGALAPGDLRMALAALAAGDDWSESWTELFQYRFGGAGPLAGHAVGNLVLTALTEQLGDPVAALDLAGRLLGAAGRVLPLSCESMDIAGEVVGAHPAGTANGSPEGAAVLVQGQVALATTAGQVVSLRLTPPAPVPCPEVLTAVASADWLVFGPGSLYTSVLPHLLVPAVMAAIAGSGARRALVLNLAPQPGETEGFSPEAHLEVLARHAPDLRLDVVLADPAAVPSPAALTRAAAALGARLQLCPVGVPGEPRHDPAKLATAFTAVFAPRRAEVLRDRPLADPDHRTSDVPTDPVAHAVPDRQQAAGRPGAVPGAPVHRGKG